MANNSRDGNYSFEFCPFHATRDMGTTEWEVALTSGFTKISDFKLTIC